MKKTCTRCGGQLNIAESQCASCGAFNPFYISSFKSPRPVNVQIDALEQQWLATAVKEQRETEKPPVDSMEQERAVRETAETGLKQEILRVKDETERYKKQTLELVKEVREELHHIDEENRRLKQEVEILSQNRMQEQALPAGISPSPVKKPKSGFLPPFQFWLWPLAWAFCIF